MLTVPVEREAEQDLTVDLELAADLNASPVIPELVDPLLGKAAEALATLIREKHLRVTRQVTSDLVDWYGKMISRLTNNLLIQRYSSYFLALHPYWRPKDCAPGESAQTEDRSILDEYIFWEEKNNLLNGNGPYPELNRLLALTFTNWLAAVGEFFDRMLRHEAELSVFFANPSLALSELTRVQFGISDPHDQGRTAAVLSFGATKLVYKPRSLDGEYGWNFIIRFLTGAGLDYHFFLPKVLKFDGYGFMEFVESTPCAAAVEVERCFERYGALLAVAHSFGTYDLHHENIIVRRDCPVVIDAEPLFRCILENSPVGESRLQLDRNISLQDIESSESVMDIGMLPHSLMSRLNQEENRFVDYTAGALHPFGLEPMSEYLTCGKGSNHLQLLEKTVKAKEFPNLPVLDQAPQLPKDHLAAIERGYRTTHAFLLAKRSELLGPGQLLDKLKALKLRLLLRPTMQYGLIFLRSISPQLLVSASRREAKIREDLRLLSQLRLDNIDQIEGHEAAALLDGDIPRFEVIAGSHQAYGTPLAFSPLSMAEQRFSRLNAAELEWQVVTIREKLTDASGRLAASARKGEAADQLLAHAAEITQSIVEAARWKNGTPFWTYTAYAPGYGCTMVHADPESLYDGVLGTAVAVAEAGRLTGNEDWMHLAQRVFTPLWRGQTPVSIHRGGGMARGLGGQLYAMLRISEATAEPALLELAVELAVKHARAVFATDELDEVLHGRSGFLLALLALYKRRPDPRLEAILATSAAGLLGGAVLHPKGICWRVLNGHSLPNVSHGTSGIAMALARWASLSGEVQARRVVEGALAYDNSFWNQSEQGWTDARVAGLSSQQATTWTWCNGRSGGLLSRMAIAQSLGTPFFDEYTQGALHAPKTDILLEASPGLCCGTAGLIDSLTQISTLMSPAAPCAHQQQAIRLAAMHSPGSHYSSLTPGLFTGTAGLAFALLRAASPDQVKSMLWFD